LALAACGGSASPGPQASGGTPASAGSSVGTSGVGVAAGTSAGGASAAGGVSTGGSSTGGVGFTLGDSKTEACIAYVLAVCGRQAQCAGSQNGNCLRVSESCPDLVFSPGATRTVEVLQACAAAYEKLPCDQVAAGILPDCVTPGTVALGAPCRFASQCASLSCGGDATCGMCVPSSHEGESCANGELCLGELTCMDGKCAPRSGSATGGALGAACSEANGMPCQAGLHCDAATSQCAGYPMLGMSCADTRTCGGDSYCELEGLICKAYPGEGMPCGVDGFTGGAGYCSESLRCARTSKGVGTCVKPPREGQPCLMDPETSLPEYSPCDASARCDATQSPPVCSAKASQGQSCSSVSDCAEGTSCICPSGQSGCDVTSTICGRIQLKGQPCTAVGDVCHPGFTCTAGVCEPRDSQGLFAAACGP
jgi:hypothetical protein